MCWLDYNIDLIIEFLKFFKLNDTYNGYNNPHQYIVFVSNLINNTYGIINNNLPVADPEICHKRGAHMLCILYWQ